MSNPHMPHASGLPLAQDERGWCVRLQWGAADLWLRGVSSEGDAGELLARLRG